MMLLNVAKSISYTTTLLLWTWVKTNIYSCGLRNKFMVKINRQHSNKSKLILHHLINFDQVKSEIKHAFHMIS
jgi:xylose isomerase